MALVKTTGIAAPSQSIGCVHSTDEHADFVICKEPSKLKAILSAIGSGKQTHFVSDGDWSMHDLVMELLKIYKPAELFLSTYALREYPVRQLVLALDKGDLLSVSMVLDYRAKVRTPEVFELANMNASKIFLTAIHAKVTVIRSTLGCVTIVGSQNWTTNPKIECGVISMDQQLAEFHINWLEKVMDNAEIFS
jgi:hypothetical protein